MNTEYIWGWKECCLDHLLLKQYMGKKNKNFNLLVAPTLVQYLVIFYWLSNQLTLQH